MYIFLPTEISSWYKWIKERRESVVESSKSLEPSFQQFGTVNATVSGSLRFDKDPVVWSAGEVPLSSHTTIILAIYRQRWTHNNQAQYTTTC